MDLTKEDVALLYIIGEGGTNIYMITQAMGVKIPEDQLKLIIEKLARMGFIKLNKEYDSRTRMHGWQFYMVKEKARPILEKHRDWIPKG
jgi:hypothetical protein